jgi:hypothetical protein
MAWPNVVSEIQQRALALLAFIRHHDVRLDSAALVDRVPQRCGVPR